LKQNGKFRPPNFLTPRISVTHFATSGVPLDAPGYSVTLLFAFYVHYICAEEFVDSLSYYICAELTICTTFLDLGIPRTEVRIPSFPAKNFRQRVWSNTPRVDQRGGGVVTAGHVVSQGHQ